MTGSTERRPPFFFSKPSDAIVDTSLVTSIKFPPHSSNVQWEAELVVAIGKEGTHIPVSDSISHVYGYAMGVDLTARDLQAKAKSEGKPWDLSKGFDFSGPISPILPKENLPPLTNQRIHLTVNGVLKQQSTIDKMIWSVPEIISYLSEKIHLKPGDLIYTGTPANVGTLFAGDVVESGGDGLPTCTFTMIK